LLNLGFNKTSPPKANIEKFCFLLLLRRKMTLTQSPSLFISGDLRFSMWIPAELGYALNIEYLSALTNLKDFVFVAGLVVGKKGSTISSIQQETKTKLLEARKPITSSLWSPVIIHGEPHHVFAAYTAVANIVDSTANASFYYCYCFVLLLIHVHQRVDEVDDVVAEFLIDRRKHYFLIGRKGQEFIKVTEIT
jgi:hypothetical protein